MALGNWDSYAVTHDGRKVHRWASPSGVEIEPYKSEVYIRTEINGRVGTIVVNSCKLRINGTSIYVRRGDPELSSSVLFVAEHLAFPNAHHRDFTPEISGVAGVGCYGYDGDRWVGVTEAHREDLRRFVAELRDKSRYDTWVEFAIESEFEI